MSTVSNKTNISLFSPQKKTNQLKIQQIGNYLLQVVINDDNFKKIVKGKHIPTGETVIVKIIDKMGLSLDSFKLKRIDQEISILKLVNHKNIIKLYEIIETSTNIYIITEFCEGGELFNYIIQKRKLPEKQTCNFFHQIIDALSYLHSHNISHRNIKPENILLHKTYEGKFILKIKNFSISTIYNNNDRYLDTPCGTTQYAPPEMLLGEKYDGLLSDIWSAGIVLYTMCFGFLPFYSNNEQEIIDTIIKGNFDFPKNKNKDLIDFFMHILDINPKTRYNIEKIKKHKWYNFVQEDKENSNIENIENNKLFIDYKVLSECCEYGYDKNQIIESVKSNKYDDKAAIYYILLNKKNNEMNNIGLNSNKNLLGKIYIIEKEDSPKVKKIYLNQKEQFMSNWLSKKRKIINGQEGLSNDSLIKDLENFDKTNRKAKKKYYIRIDNKVNNLIDKNENDNNLIRNLFFNKTFSPSKKNIDKKSESQNASISFSKNRVNSANKKENISFHRPKKVSLTPISLNSKKIYYNKIVNEDSDNEKTIILQYKLNSHKNINKNKRNLYDNELNHSFTPYKNKNIKKYQNLYWVKFEELINKKIKNKHQKNKSFNKKLLNDSSGSRSNINISKDKIKKNLENLELNIVKTRKKYKRKLPDLKVRDSSNFVKKNESIRNFNNITNIKKRDKNTLINVSSKNEISGKTSPTKNSTSKKLEKRKKQAPSLFELKNNKKMLDYSLKNFKMDSTHISQKQLDKMKNKYGPIDLKCVIIYENLNKIIDKVKFYLNKSKVSYIKINPFKFHVICYDGDFDIELCNISGNLIESKNKLFYINFYDKQKNKKINNICCRNKIVNQIINDFHNKYGNSENS